MSLCQCTVINRFNISVFLPVISMLFGGRSDKYVNDASYISILDSLFCCRIIGFVDSFINPTIDKLLCTNIVCSHCHCNCNG